MPDVEISAKITETSCEFTIGDRKLSLDVSERGVTRLLGAKGEVLDNTIGGIIASKLFSIFGDIRSGLENIGTTADVWETLRPDEVEDFYDRVG